MRRAIFLSALLLGTGGAAQARPEAARSKAVAVIELAPPAEPTGAPMLVLTVARDGRLFLGPAALPSAGSRAERMDSLGRILASNDRLRKDAPLALEIDENAPVGELLAVLETVRRAGIQRLVLIRPLPSPLPLERR